MQKRRAKIDDEENLERGLNFNVVYRFIGWWLLMGLLLDNAFVLERSSYGTCDWWLSVWSSVEKAPKRPGFGWPAATTVSVSRWYSYVYWVRSTMIILVFARLNTFVMCICKAAEKVFETTLWCT